MMKRRKYTEKAAWIGPFIEKKLSEYSPRKGLHHSSPDRHRNLSPKKQAFVL